MEKVASSVLDSASSPIRLEILKLLKVKESLPYTEIMTALNLDPIRDAGKFVYHLRNLIDTGLIFFDKGTKKYSVTDLGQLLVKFSRDIEEFIAVKKGKMLVRTSRFAIEEFDRDKISNSLVKEAGVPLELSQDIAVDAEERLIKLKTRYLTAPLIREFINAILIEKGFEEYRHKLTRLGMPLYDLSLLFEEAGKKSFDINDIQRKASSSVLNEYVLLSGVPRLVADEYLSGSIHIEQLENWILKPDDIYYDIRTFLKEGFLNDPPPKNLSEALALLYRVYKRSISEASKSITFDFFNIFLAPYIQNMPDENIKENFAIFLKNVNTYKKIFEPHLYLGIELSIPKYLTSIESIKPSGKKDNGYEYYDQTYSFTRILINVINEVTKTMPLLNPRLIFKYRNQTILDTKIENIAEKIHILAQDYGIPHFAFLKNEEKATVQSEGLKLNNDWTQDWEVDCLKTGNLGTVFLNLPRIAYESKGKDDEFLTQLDKSIEVAVDAFKSKRDAIEKRLLNKLLPMLSYRRKSFSFSLENIACSLSFIGLNEAVKTHTGKNLYNEADAVKFGSKVIDRIDNQLNKISNDPPQRIILTQKPSEEGAIRLANLDIEKYGKEMKLSRPAKTSDYMDVPLIPLTQSIPIQNRLNIEANFNKQLRGGSISVLPIKKVKSIEKLMKITESSLEKGLNYLVYARPFSHCQSCYNTFKDFLPICPHCRSDNISHISRISGMLKPTSQWSSIRLKESKKWRYYNL